MFPHVRPHERAYRDDAQALGTAGVERSFHQCLADMPAAKTYRNFCVNESQRVGRPFVDQVSRQAIHRQLKTVQRTIVRYSRLRHAKDQDGPKEGTGRGDWIRTSDISLPKRALYQAEPRPDSRTCDPDYPTRADLKSAPGFGNTTFLD